MLIIHRVTAYLLFVLYKTRNIQLDHKHSVQFNSKKVNFHIEQLKFWTNYNAMDLFDPSQGSNHWTTYKVSLRWSELNML